MVFKIVYKGLVVLILFLLGFIFVSNAEALSVGIDKPRIEAKSAPGSAPNGVIKVKNKGDVPASVQASVEDWIYDANGKREFKPAGSTPFSCGNWIEITPQSTIVPSGREGEFAYTIRVPNDAVGGHYAIIFFSSSSVEEEESKGTAVKLVGRIGSVVYHEVEGKTNKAASITSMDISKPEVNKPLTLTYTFKNEGNTFLRLKGILNILDKAGTIFGKAESESMLGSLPGDIRKDTIKWFGALPKGSYDIILTVDIGEDVPPLVRQTSITMERDAL